MTGVFSGTPDFDPGTGTEVFSSANGNIFLAGYDAAGDFRFAFSLGVTSVVGELATSIVVDAIGNGYITGEYTGRPTSTRAAANFCSRRQASPLSWPAIRRAAACASIGMGGTERDRGLDLRSTRPATAM